MEIKKDRSHARQEGKTMRKKKTKEKKEVREGKEKEREEGENQSVCCLLRFRVKI